MSKFDTVWRKYWYRAFPSFALWAGFVFFMFLCNSLPSRGLVWTALISYLAILLGAFEYLRRFPCPRCGQFFSRSLWYGRGLRNPRCVHCGLKRFGDPRKEGGAGIL
jgi:hypothetical protein